MAVPTSGINLPHAPRRYRPTTAPDAPQGALPGAEAEPDSLGGPDPESLAERRIEVEVVEEVVVEPDKSKPVIKKATARKRTPAKSRTTKKATPSGATPPPSDS